ncbi:hypothetical protein SCP_1500130 [Sparassis crispa]|uniref:Uncharacterized protein n=1 Tax=Sparassis crispa TaxID=139825 RepID=A0A401H3M9_9APHY|nr:hypothetical protein SCP_1500130 [Sparassis crispa]GBE89011.1 hypothetical protein SCP_1500130 [Sparassis crispa]
MSFVNLPEPATQATLADARRELVSDRLAVRVLSDKIQAAEDDLARIVEESRCAVRDMERERAALQEKVALTLAYISPIRRLPHELLRYIFLLNFEDYPCCAWVLSAVCSLWRRLVLSMPVLWSKIRLVTTQSTSADTIRLWLERSGTSVPLDIEIFLRSEPFSGIDLSCRRRSSSTSAHGWTYGPAGWTTTPSPLAHPGLGANAHATYVQVPQTAGIHFFPIAQAAQLVVANGVASAPSTASQEDPWDMPPLVSAERAPSLSRSKTSMHWGHIAFFYLVEQMRRWERFVFRFDKQFASFTALKAIEGDAPLLREFEVSCADSAFYHDWKWLPSASANSTFDISSLTTLTLHHVPFKWSAPMLRNLHSLSLRTLPTVHLALDRILYIIASNPELETLSLHFTSPNPPVLPLTPTTLQELKVLNLGGHYLLSTLVDSLILPSLDVLILDIDARDPIEDTVASLLARSNNPSLTRLSLAYGLGPGANSGFYYGGAGVASWHFLGELDHLLSLQIGSAPFEPLLATLGAPDDDPQQDHWICPNLRALAMRGCHHTHGDGVSKLVQMVEARNPEISAAGPVPYLGGVVAPARLRQLELYDCASLGPDVIKWLKTRIEDVACTEPLFEGSPRSPAYPYL